jgi:hypothetical protein
MKEANSRRVAQGGEHSVNLARILDRQPRLYGIHTKLLTAIASTL